MNPVNVTDRTHFVVSFGTKQEFATALADKLHGRHVEVAAYPTPFEPHLGLLFSEDASAVCIECTVYHHFDTIRIYANLCERARAGVDLLVIIPGYTTRYTYSDTTDVEEIAQDVAGQFWTKINLGPSWE